MHQNRKKSHQLGPFSPWGKKYHHTFYTSPSAVAVPGPFPIPFRGFFPQVIWALPFFSFWKDLHEPGSSNMAGWKMGALDWRYESPIKNGDVIPACHVRKYPEGMCFFPPHKKPHTPGGFFGPPSRCPPKRRDARSRLIICCHGETSLESAEIVSFATKSWEYQGKTIFFKGKTIFFKEKTIFFKEKNISPQKHNSGLGKKSWGVNSDDGPKFGLENFKISSWHLGVHEVMAPFL